ncbi:MAG: DNA recombination protein RmuC [SAR86 cluster bacterium]|uniref:DNA recombination protein RmuC n=1 Tax=SAR86 cluster bacterium TaxID=2030880 RepID=A0A2A4WVE9_9GAMM|nr:MAG: DNA recombination protein RmuC [SAR86 cluster bacterium]
MNSPVVIALTLLAVTLIGILVWALRQSQQLKLAELSSREKLLAREAELGNAVQSLHNSDNQNASLRQELQSLREHKTRLETSLEMEKKQHGKDLAFLNESKEQMGEAFENIANKIFDAKSKKLVDNNKESLATVLNPLQDKIRQFEKRVEDTYDKESKERFSLAREIKQLQEMNTQISEDAVNLTNALKGDNKAQGNWGEMILETLLENSGLVKGREYEVQVSLQSTEGGKFQPDVIIHLPESRDIIVDSKVSLKAWDAYCSTDEVDEKAELLKQHVQSVRNHVKSLSGKDYQNLAGISTLDYVFMFMPIDAAYSVAIQNDPGLSQYAFEKNIVFVSPTMLLTTLKLAQNLWRLDQQNRNAVEIAEKAGALYDKFVNFVADLEDVGARIDSSKKSYDRAHNKLRSGTGNLIRRVEDLKTLGAKTSKKLEHDALATDTEEDPPGTELKGAADDGKKESPGKARH